MAYSSSIVMGPQLISPTSAGTPVKSVVWAVDNTLAAPQFAAQLNKIVSRVSSPNGVEEETVVLGASPELNTGHFKNAATVSDELVTLHGLWNPAHDPSLMRKINMGLKKWHNSADGKPSDAWCWAGGRFTLGSGLSGVRDFLSALAQLIPLAVGGNKAISGLATELYETYEREVMGAGKNYEDALAHADEKVAKFTAFFEPFAKDIEPLIISTNEALPVGTTFLDCFILSKVRKGELGAGLAQLAKSRLSEGALALANKFQIHLLMAEMTNEIQIREQEAEEDRLADACSRVEAEVEQSSKNRGGHVQQDSQDLLEDISDEDTVLTPTPQPSPPPKRNRPKNKNKENEPPPKTNKK